MEDMNINLEKLENSIARIVYHHTEKLENSIAAMQCQITEMRQNVELIQQSFDTLQRGFEVVSTAYFNSIENVPKACQNCSKTAGNSTMETVEPLIVKRKGVERASAKTMERAKSMPKRNFHPEKGAIVYNTISTPKGGALLDNKIKAKPSNVNKKNPPIKKKDPPIKKDETLDLKKVRKVIPPKLEWIKRYCTQRSNGINPRQFFDFYESKGWLIGRVKMKDWQASVRTWERSKKQGVLDKPPIYDDGIKYIWDAKIQKYRHSISGTIYIP